MASLKKSLENRSSQDNAAKIALAALHPLVAHLNAVLSAHLNAGPNLKPPHLLLALSGGLDSCVLLHLLNALKKSGALRFELHALHVHHGLSAHADAWADFCLNQCQPLNIPLKIVHVQVEKDTGMGIEAAARRLRYEALFNCSIGHELSTDETLPDYIVTAHHQDDQAETLLLQLFRGAGVKGLASMALADQSRRLLRPLLNVLRQALHDYALQHSLQWCDDESNTNTQYERNFVRHEVLTMLEARAPAVKTVLARTASHLAEASDLLDLLAEIDAQSLLSQNPHGNSLCLQGLRVLETPRAKNVLRWWFSQRQLMMPSADQLNEILDQLFNAKPDANLCILLQHLSIKRYQQRAYLVREQVVQSFDLVWNGEPSLMLPNGGQLQFKQVTGAGLAVKFGMTKLRITNRDGGERFKPNALRPTRTLKHLLQEANIPPWQRAYLPLIYWHDTLACVPGIGITHELQAAAHEQGIAIIWQDTL